jgi:hypothetical protein
MILKRVLNGPVVLARVTAVEFTEVTVPCTVNPLSMNIVPIDVFTVVMVAVTMLSFPIAVLDVVKDVAFAVY